MKFQHHSAKLSWPICKSGGGSPRDTGWANTTWDIEHGTHAFRNSKLELEAKIINWLPKEELCDLGGRGCFSRSTSGGNTNLQRIWQYCGKEIGILVLVISNYILFFKTTVPDNCIQSHCRSRVLIYQPGHSLIPTLIACCDLALYLIHHVRRNRRHAFVTPYIPRFWKHAGRTFFLSHQSGLPRRFCLLNSSIAFHTVEA